MVTTTKTIHVKMTFDGYLHDLKKVTPEYVLRVFKNKGLIGGGVLVEIEN